MADDETFADQVVRWFTDVPDDSPDVSKRRALAWFATPNARVVATRVRFGSGSVDDILGLAMKAVGHWLDLPAWDGPIDAEQYLRGLLDGIAYVSLLERRS